MRGGSIFSVINHKWSVSPRLNDFKFTGMVYCNHSSLVIFVKDAKYIHFYPNFRLPPALSHCKYKPFIKSSKFCYSLQVLAKMFASNVIIDLSYNFSNYIATVRSIWKLFEVGCLHQHSVPASLTLGSQFPFNGQPFLSRQLQLSVVLFFLFWMKLLCFLSSCCTSLMQL